MNKSKRVAKVIRFINFGIFPGHVCFCCGFTIDELIEQFSKKKYKDYPEYLVALKDEDIKNHGKYFAVSQEMTKGKITKPIYFIIMQDKFLFLDGSYIILAHEVLHICQFFLKRILTRDNEIEAEAYLHSYIMQMCLDALRGKD